MSAQVTPAKRPHEQSLTEVIGKRKWQKSSALGSDNAPFLGSSSSKIVRLLCPASKIGGIIGKGGSTISQIRQETGAKVRVEETVPGCDERVIIIVGSDKDDEVVAQQVKPEVKETKSSEPGENPEHAETDEKQAGTVDDSRSEKEKATSSIQKALLVVFDKMVDGLSETNEGDDENSKQSSSVVRLLVFSGQVGCLLGKAGSVIKQMSSESGAQIRILPKDKLPACASSSDELVQISGRLDAIRKALQSVSQQLLENYPRNQESFAANVIGPSSHSFGPPPRQDRFPPSNRPLHGHGAPYSSVFHDGEANIPGRMNFPPEVLSFRLLCNEEKVGGVIGKGGSIVKALQHETGCEIKVLDGGAGSEEDRIIIVSGPAYPDDGISAPQDAVLRVQSRIFRAAPENKDQTMTAKLLVSSHQIGCLLGKGGSVIAEMRKSTGAYIRILGKDQVPKNASENEEVVQVTGEFEVVQEALLQITSRLRNHFFRDVFPPLGHPPNPAYLEQMPPPFPSYMGMREFSPSGTFSHRGPSFNKFDGPGGLPPVGGFHPHDDHPPFAHDFPRPGISPHMSERMSSAAPWGPQGPIEGPGSMGFPDYSGAPQRRLGGFGGGNQPAIITSTTVEVVVPRFVVPAIYGEDGGCLRQIREISDAKITITDPKPGATETVIIISGTPEQTNAAQSLIQAFVMSETEAS
ncbi:RNA-binding KH domain-containing protein RCF3 [Sesamum alatum]|uniref:RNA-binding KH domain-containing protein RCF3 n=1 Tax=Sesamum alatum TaxID=300844 RepID=A0AAE1YES4_9LAMI|nr:RNA-binding KH domain-containing protein RCF3 [Sesamum alatum]